MTDNVSKFIYLLLLFIAPPLWADSAVLAAGDMWRAEAAFEAMAGVSRVETGYANPPDGSEERRQAVRVHFDNRRLGYGDLLGRFWQLVDGDDGEGQYCNRGKTFAPALLPQSDYQWRLAEASLARWRALHGRESRVSFWSQSQFTPAPEMEDWASRHPWRFGVYARRCGGWPLPEVNRP
ncbi:MAG: peptide-methionine (S)-S-oxide reductase [Aeromonas sp.]|uniref:peptide-methionine (S)-S-oxide reductase n=1 Tax=Aeromonas sp. TaxID=647 RepID=UPI002FCA1C55